MTAVALGAGDNVRCRFNLGILRQESTRVTDRTVTGSQRSGRRRMIHHAWYPGGVPAGMAGIALRRGRHVHCRLGQRIGKVKCAVMAGDTLTGRAGVIHLRRFELRNIRMAGIALHGSGHMVGRLANRIDVVVTGRTTACNRRLQRGMIRLGGSGPGGRRFMAAVALRGGRNVGGRLGLGILIQQRTTVAGGAVAGGNRSRHVGMHYINTNSERRECHADGMTGIAAGGGGHMGCRFAGGADSVMTGRAGARHNQRVVKTGGQPGRYLVTGITGSRGDRMDLGFAGSEDAIVAGSATGNRHALRNGVFEKIG